ncbi:MAG: hypothetical protein E7389_02045 [Ruminococcaceae bacterium]|nr:hypothetical protein [Oscillospiraceae bacterium]
MKKVKILEIILAVMMIFAVTVMPSLADEPVEDVTITSSIFSAGQFAEPEPATGCVKVDSSQVYDAAMGKSVRRFYSSSYTDKGSAGSEPRIFLAGKNEATSLGGIDYSADTYGYVRLTTDLYIDNATNGIALRFARYDSTTKELVGASSTGSYYIGIGGSSFSAGKGVSCVCNDLVPRKWQRVVIEIGVDSTHKDVNFYVDDVKSETTCTLADNTYGIGTKQGGNFSVLILRGTKGKVYDVRISDFTIKATVSGYNPETSGFTGYNVNEPYVFNNDATLTRAEENNITVETVQAPQIDSEVYTKKVLHLSSDSFANGTGGYTSGTYAQAGNLPIFSMVSKKEKLGGVDYSDYNYLRVRFNIFVNDSHNGVILKLSRYASDNSTVFSPDYVFGIGAIDFSNISYNAASAETYQCRQLTVGKWNDVLLELGVQANNATMKIYVNGEEKSFAEWTNGETPTFGVNNGTGYCGASANRCGIIPKSGFDKPLDMYLSDVSVTVAKEAYDIESIVYPTVECASEDAVAYGSGIYTRDSSNITNEILTKVNADYAAVLTDLGRVVSYNDSYKTFKYYNIVTKGFITRINSADYSGEDTDVNAMVINVDGDINKATLVVAYYKENEGGDGASLVMAKFFDEDISKLYNDLNETADKPKENFDFVKVFALRGVGNMRSIGRARSF